VTEQRCFKSPGRVETKTVVSGIVTRIDLLDYISKNEGNAGGASSGIGKLAN